MTPRIRFETKTIRDGKKLIEKKILLMLIEPHTNLWIEAKNGSEEEYNRLRKKFGYA